MANEIRYQVDFDIKQGDLNKLKASLQDLQKMKISDIMKINDADAASATNMLNKIKVQAKNVEDALKNAFNTKLNTVNITEFNHRLQESGSSIRQIYEIWSKAGVAGENAFRNLSSQVLSTNIQLKESHNLLEKMATTLANTIKWNIASGAINGVSRSIEQAWGYTKSLDTSLNNIRIVTGKSAEEMDNFAEKANEAAQSLGKTTTDYTNAALIYAQQGLSDKEIEERAKITLMTANVTGQSTADVSEELTAVWNGYKVSAEEAQVYIDRLAAVAATTASDLEELSTGMSKVASAAAAMGVGEDQLAAQLATIISVTRQAPESVGTALRTVYARISDIKAGIDEDGVTLGNYSGKMAELGFNVLDAAGNLRDMGEVMQDIGNRWQDLTREQQISLAQTMAGQRQYSNLIALFDNFEKYNQSLETARNAAGTLQEQQDIYMESTAAHLQTLKAAVENVYDSLADTDSINNLTEGITLAANTLADFIDTIGGGENLLKMLGTIGVTVFGTQIAKGISTTITNFEIGKENVRQFNEALQATKDWQGIPGLDEVSKDLLQNRQQLLELSRLMTPEQFSGMQQLLNDITKVGNELTTLTNQQESLRKATQAVLTGTDPWQSFDEILKDESGQQTVINRITEQINSIKQARDVLKKYNTELKELGQSSLKGNDISDQLIKAKEELQSYIRKLKEMADNGQLERHRDQIEKLEKQLSQLDDSLPADQLESKLSLIGGQLQGIAANATTTASNLKANLEKEFAQTAESLETQIDNINQKLKEMKTKFDLNVDKQSGAVAIENYTKIASSISSIGIAIQQVQNIGSIITDENLSAGEKLLRIFTNLGFIIPSIINAYQSLKAVMTPVQAVQALAAANKEAQTAARLKNAAAMQAEAVAQDALTAKKIEAELVEMSVLGIENERTLALRKQLTAILENIGAENAMTGGKAAAVLANEAAATSEAAYTKAVKASAAAQKAFIKTLVTNPLFIFATAIIGIVTVLDALTLSTKEANDALEKSSNAYEEAKSGLKSLQDELEKTNNRIKELQNQDSLSLVQQEELAKLQSLNTQLEIQKTNQEEILKIKSKEKALDISNKIGTGFRQSGAYESDTVSQFNESQQNNNINPQAQAAIKDVIGVDLQHTQLTDIQTLNKVQSYLSPQRGRPLQELWENFSGIDIAALRQNIQKSKQQGMKILAENYSSMISELHALQEDEVLNETDHSTQINYLENLLYQYYLGSGNLDSTIGKIVAKTGEIDQETFNKIQEQLKKDDKFKEINSDNAEGFLSQLFGQEDADLLKIQLDGIGLSVQQFLNVIKNSKLDWTGFLNNAGLEQEANKTTGIVASLSGISQSGEKLQSGKNLSKKENQAYQENLNSVIESANEINDQDLIKSAQLLQDTWLAGSEEYQRALDAVLQKIIELKTEQAKQENRTFTQEQIADIEKYATTVERVNELYKNGSIQDQVHYHALLDKAIREEIKTLKVSGPAYQNYVKQLEKLREKTTSAVDGVNDLGEQVNLSDEALQQMALNDLKLVDSLQKLQKSYKNLKDDLNTDPSSIKFMNAMSELVDIINNIPGIHIDLTDENAISYLTNVKEIAEGTQGAVQRLRQKLAEQEIEKIKVEADLDENSVTVDILNTLNGLIHQLSPDDIRTHAYLQDTVFVNQLNKLIKDAKLTEQQCNRILSAIGVEANIEYTTIPTFSGYDDGSDNGGVWGENASSSQQIIKKITYKPINSTSDDGGIISAGGGGGKGGGGGGGKESKPDTSQKQTEELLKDQVDIYHDINIELDDLNRNLDNTKKKQERLYGKDLKDNLTEQNHILDQQIDKLEQKYQLQKQDQKQKQEELSELGVIFDEYGKIGNYMDLLYKQQDKVNEIITQKNELIKQFNQTTDAERKKELNKLISELEDKEKHAQKILNNLKKGMDDYDQLMDDMQENEDERQENRQQQFQNNIQKFRTDIEIRLDMGEAEKDWNNFRRNVLNHSNILKDSEFDKMLKDVEQNYQDILSYFDINGQMGTLQALTDQINATQDELDEINGGGESSIYGDNKKQAMQDLQSDLSKLMQQMEDIESLIDDIDQTYLDTIDDIMDQFDKQIEDYALIGELIEHDVDLLSLLYGDRNYDAMDKYYTTLQNNNLKQLDSLRQQRDFWKQQWDEAVAREDNQAAKKFEENYKETINNLNSLIEESAENLKNKYMNAIDDIFNELDKKLSGGIGTDYLSLEWDLLNKNADEYLDTINAAFAVQELEDKFRKALNDTNSLKAQQALKNLMDQQLNNLRAKEKLTEYDVERAEKLLQIEQARIALEDAQASKTSMRLKRDSQGNYSYEYVADQGNIADAQQNLANAQNDLYNFDKDRYQSNLGDMLSAWKDFQEEYKQIVTDVSLTEEQRVAKTALLREQYGQYINDKTAENMVIRTNLMESAFIDIAAIYQTDVGNYQQMADDEKNILMSDLVPAWESGIQQMADKVAGEGGFIPVCEEAFENITEATEDYKDELDEMARVAGVDLNDVKQGVDDLAISFADLVEKNDDLLDRMDKEMDAISDLKDAAHELKKEYDNVYEAAKRAVSAAHDSLQDTRADQWNDDDDDWEDSDDDYLDDGAVVNDIGPGVGLTNNQTYDKPYSIEGTWTSVKDDDGSYSIYRMDADKTQKIASNQSAGNVEDAMAILKYDYRNRYGHYDTGGYTGNWSGNQGIPAILHKKELVLNATDTENMLNSVEILRGITSSLGGNLFNRLSDISSYSQMKNMFASDGVEQNVHIDASFPNVDSKREIEEALSDLVNLAAQRAMRNR